MDNTPQCSAAPLVLPLLLVFVALLNGHVAASSYWAARMQQQATVYPQQNLVANAMAEDGDGIMSSTDLLYGSAPGPISAISAMSVAVVMPSHVSAARVKKPANPPNNVQIPSWVTYGMSVGYYGSDFNYPTKAVGPFKSFGDKFFFGVNLDNIPNVYPYMYQNIPLNATMTSLIKTGQASAYLAAYIGGYQTDTDYSEVLVTFLTATKTIVGQLKTLPLTRCDRDLETLMARQPATGFLTLQLPSTVVSAQIKVTCISNYQYPDVCRGYVDNIFLGIA